MTDSRSRRGFILLIVIGILGVLGMLGVAIVFEGRTSSLLGKDQLNRARVRLFARSGVEAGLSRAWHALSTDPMISVHDDFVVTLDSIAGEAWDATRVRVRDSSGRIDLNDGILAGQVEHAADPIPGGYSADALDPWPGSDITDPDRSALVNLRLRRILNAYGDVRLFLAEKGDWPAWNTRDPQSDDPLWGDPVTFTSSAAGDRGISMPAADGLGDAVIGARPAGGYLVIEDVESVVFQWGEQHLPSGVDEFVAAFLRDVTLNGDADTACARMTRELGVYDNEFTHKTVETFPLDSQPPQISDLWRPHAVTPVNLNLASNAVRAAVFYAVVNPSYVCESGAQESVVYSEGQGEALYLQWHLPSFLSQDPDGALPYSRGDNVTPTLGVAGPCFEPTRMFENGVDGTTSITGEDASYNGSIQKNRLMGLRDAMVLAQAYDAYAKNDPQTNVHGMYPGGFPDGFTMFSALLKAIEADDVAGDYERATVLGSEIVAGDDRTRFPHYRHDVPDDILRPETIAGDADYAFRQTYVERTLPHLLSNIRRLPGWMNAPVALMSPYLHPRFSAPYPSDLTTLPGRPLRSVEDFTWRVIHPKVTFQPGGQITIRADAVDTDARGWRRHSVRAVVRLARRGTWRSQQDFEALTDRAAGRTDVLIQIGPEPKSGPTPAVPPHLHLGTVGVADHMVDLPGRGLAETWMAFEPASPFDTGGVPSDKTLEPKNPEDDEALGGVAHAQRFPLLNSMMEGNQQSLFVDNGFGSDLSPFGGLSFSSFGHGPRATGVDADDKRFRDTLYFRPTDVLDDGDMTSRVYSKGLITFWYRVPSGLRLGNRTLFHLALWERITLKSNVQEEELDIDFQEVEHYRPVYFGATLNAFNGQVLAAHATPSRHYLCRPWQPFELPTTHPNYGIDIGLAPYLGESPDLESPANNLGTLPFGSYADLSDMIVQSSEFINEIEPESVFEDWFLDLGRGNPDPDYFNAFVEEGQFLNSTRIAGYPIGRAIGGSDNSGRATPEPGSWQRVVVGWDLSRPYQMAWDRFWGANLVTQENPEDLLGETPHKGHFLIQSHVDQMILTFGETPLHPYHADPVIEHSLINQRSPVLTSPIIKDMLVPWNRLNSSIDNIQMRFGHEEHAEYLELGIENPDDSYYMARQVQELLMQDPDRYDLGPGRRWVIDPGALLPAWQGARVLGVSARIFDVPRGEDMAATSPRVDTTLEDFSGATPVVVAPVSATPATRAYLTMVREPGGFSTIGNASTEASYYPWIPVNPDLRVVLSWTKGGSTEPMVNIPWVQEVSVLYGLPEPVIRSWDVVDAD